MGRVARKKGRLRAAVAGQTDRAGRPRAGCPGAPTPAAGTTAAPRVPGQSRVCTARRLGIDFFLLRQIPRIFDNRLGHSERAHTRNEPKRAVVQVPSLYVS